MFEKQAPHLITRVWTVWAKAHLPKRQGFKQSKEILVTPCKLTKLS